jgi:hypothetical protein
LTPFDLYLCYLGVNVRYSIGSPFCRIRQGLFGTFSGTFSVFVWVAAAEQASSIGRRSILDFRLPFRHGEAATEQGHESALRSYS